MRRLWFNGKFLTASPTGVHRVAEELIRACDQRLAEIREEMKGRDALEATLLHPRNIQRELPLRAIPHLSVGHATGPLWEQTELARAAHGGTLVNLCNLGPVIARDAVTMIHDAQVREAPTSYSAAFRAYYNVVQPVIARRHKSVLTVSKYAGAALVRHKIAPADAVQVVPNGVDHVHRTPPDVGAARARGLTPGRYVLALANAQPHKNIAMLIRAFNFERLAGAQLVLFGDDHPARIEPSAGRNVAHLGRVSDAELYGLMAQAGAFACPSLTEGFGLPPLEAMAMGAPVIAAPCGALPEVLGPAATYADPHEPGDWADAIIAALALPEARARRAAEGRARAELFRWDRAGDLLLKAVSGVVEDETVAAPSRVRRVA